MLAVGCASDSGSEIDRKASIDMGVSHAGCWGCGGGILADAKHIP